MRIISGKYRGRQIHPPNHIPVRPTTDFAKEGLFNILNNLVDFEKMEVLDLFAGTGSISYEFFSRGCKKITAVEINHRCAAFIQKTAEAMNAEGFRVFQADVFRFIQRPGLSYNLVFADPPYELDSVDLLAEKVMHNSLLEPEGWFILEHSKDHDFSGLPEFYDHRKYGNVNFTFFKKQAIP